MSERDYDDRPWGDVYWIPVKEILFGWPGARPISKEQVDGYVEALRAAGGSLPVGWRQVNPTVVLSILTKMRDADTSGFRPAMGTIRGPLLRKMRSNMKLEQTKVERARELMGGPVPDFDSAPNDDCRRILLRAQAASCSIAPPVAVRHFLVTGRTSHWEGADRALVYGIAWARSGGWPNEVLYGDPLSDEAWCSPYVALWPEELEQIEQAKHSDEQDVYDPDEITDARRVVARRVEGKDDLARERLASLPESGLATASLADPPVVEREPVAAISIEELLADALSGLALGGATLGATGIDLPPTMKLDRWLELGELFCRLHRSSPWWLGDWWNFGEAAYGERASAAALVGIHPDTLSNYARVARAIPPPDRIEGLSFRAHALVAALDPRARNRWLKRAVKEGWNSTSLNSALVADGAIRRRGHDVNGNERPRVTPSEALSLIRADPVWREVAEVALSQIDQLKCPECGHSWSEILP